MVHTVELVFDADTEGVIRNLWADLAGAGIPSQAPASRPHVTLAVAERIAPEIDALLQPLGNRFPLPCTVGAPVLFGRVGYHNTVVARLVVPTGALLALHADVHRCGSAQLTPGPAAHSRPGQWTAHVTLARRVHGTQLGRALRIVSRPSQLQGSFVGLRRWDGDERAEYPIGR